MLEELDDVVSSFGTRPVVVRSDNGPPFNSADYEAWCTANGITPVRGVPHHSQGQGLVETRFRPLAAAIIAVLGHKAPHEWWPGMLLSRLEGILNSTVGQPNGGSPFWVMHGLEARTPLSAQFDWLAPGFCASELGIPTATSEDIQEIVAQHHARINNVQGRAMLASSLAQALTKRAWDADRVPGDYKVGESVLVYQVAPNRLLPFLSGPYSVHAVTADGNFVRGAHYLTPESVVGPFHVSRLVRFNASRATTADIAEFHCEVGQFVVDDVIEHRKLASGDYEFHIRWRGTPLTSWQRGCDVGKVYKVQAYCKREGLPDTAVANLSGAGNSRRAKRHVKFKEGV